LPSAGPGRLCLAEVWPLAGPEGAVGLKRGARPVLGSDGRKSCKGHCPKVAFIQPVCEPHGLFRKQGAVLAFKVRGDDS